MTVDECYKRMLFVCRKNQIGSLSPTDFQYAFNIASLNYYDTLIGKLEEYQYFKVPQKISISMTNNIVSRLTPFEKQTTPTVTSGLVTKPSDFNKILAMYTTNNYRIYKIEENRFAERMQDSIDPIDELNAFYVEQAANWRVYPTTLTSVILRYLSTPTFVIWNYTSDGSGRPVYTSTGSQDPQWKDNDIDEIIARAVKLVGISLKEPVLTQFADQVSK